MKLAIALLALAGCSIYDDTDDGTGSGANVRLTATRTEGSGCTTAPTLVLVIDDLLGDAPVARHEGEGATGPDGRHDPGDATCTQAIEDNGTQTSCTFVAGSGPDAFVEHIRIEDGAGPISVYLGVPPCDDYYTITSVEHFD